MRAPRRSRDRARRAARVTGPRRADGESGAGGAADARPAAAGGSAEPGGAPGGGPQARPPPPVRGPAALARVLGVAEPEPPPAPAVAWVDGPIADLLPRPRPAVPAAAVVLTLLVTLAMLMFVLTEPERRWIALAGAAAAAIGADGLLRRARPDTFALGVSTVPQLILPTLYALALPLFAEHNARGPWTLPAALAAGLGFGAILVAEVRSAREFESGFAPARIVAGAGAYLTAFAVLSRSPGPSGCRSGPPSPSPPPPGACSRSSCCATPRSTISTC